MVTLKTDEEIQTLREGGRRLAAVMREVITAVSPGVHTKELNDLAERLMRERGGESSLLGYHPSFAKRAYPAAICVSVNDEVVHGIPTENDIELKDGDIVGLDMVMTYKGLVVDMAKTVPVGTIDAAAKKLLAATEEALYAGIKAVRSGKRLGDIGSAIEQVAIRNKLGIVYELGGHGVGYKVHEEPMVPNFGDPNTGHKLETNLVLAIEPMLNEGVPEVKLQKDGYTYKTADGSRSAHFEHTVAVTERGAVILTEE